MVKPSIQTTKQVVPMIYGYSTPEVMRHNGWTKIGYTEQEVETRIKQQTHTADVKWNLERKGNATFDDLMSLIKIVQDEVYEKTGYKLECEPVIIR